MNGSPQLPQYTFDPATQQYRLKTPAEQAQEQQKGKAGLGGLYEATGGAGISPQGPVGFGMMGPGMAEMGVAAQNIGNALAGVPSIGAAIGSAVASGIGNSMMGSQVSPVANPSPMTVSEVAPDPAFSALAAMNAQQAAESEANEAAAAQSAAVGEAASAAAAGVGEAAADAAADAGDAAAGDAGGGGDGGSGDGAGDGGGNAAGSAGVGDGEREGGMIRRKNYKEGGIASLAEKVESKGRGDDKVLVHMTPREVAGLQYLAMQHGGSLTINPDTGLPEAGFLDSILPMIAGAALTATGVGAPLAALMVGGGYGLATGSLEKGLFAGLGAFGGANLAAGLGQAGAASTAGQTLTPSAAQAAAVTPQAATAVPGALPAGGGKFLQAAGTQMIPQGAASLAPAGSTAALQTAAAGAPQGFMANVSRMGTGISNLAQGTPGAREAFMQTVGGPMGLATKVAGPIAGTMFSAEEPDEGGKKPQEYIRPYSFDFKPSAETDPNFKFRTGERGESTAEQRYFTPTFTPMGVFKAGTEPGPSFYGTPTEDLYNLYSGPKQGDVASGVIPEGQLGSGLQRFMAPSGGFDRFAQSRINTITGSSPQGRFSAGGIAGLRKGRFLEDKTDSTGNSDGMSDDMPAVINGEQPARLTDGEFVVPADVVSHLGNGSSKAGAKRLHNMMDRIRAARTGTKKQAPAVKAEKFMPA